MARSDLQNETPARALQRSRAEVDRLRRSQLLLCDLLRRVTASLDVPTVLQEVVGAACELTGARYGALAVFGDSGRIQQFYAHGVVAEEWARIGKLPAGRGCWAGYARPRGRCGWRT